MAIKYRLLGSTGVQVSSLCMGTMTFGREADKSTSMALFQRCRERGINFFDCANVYAGGESEVILGKLIADCRQDIIISSKVCGKMGDDINARGASRRHIMAAAEASLQRLKTDYIDIYYIHQFDPLTPLEDSLHALENLVRQGKILYPAISNFAAWQASKSLGICNKHGWERIRVIQPMYNLLKRQAEVEILPMAHEENLAVVSYSPLAGGLLTGKYKPGQKPTAGRFSESKLYESRYRQKWTHEAAQRFCSFSREQELDPVALAIAWVAHHPAITAPIIGARSIEQLNASLKALDIEMTPELYGRLCELTPTPPPANDRTEQLPTN